MSKNSFKKKKNIKTVKTLKLIVMANIFKFLGKAITFKTCCLKYPLTYGVSQGVGYNFLVYSTSGSLVRLKLNFYKNLLYPRIGGESLAVAQNNYAVVWFMGKELNLVFGLQLSFARVGSTVNLIVLGPVYKWVEKTLHYHGYECLGVTLFLGKL